MSMLQETPTFFKILDDPDDDAPEIETLRTWAREAGCSVVELNDLGTDRSSVGLLCAPDELPRVLSEMIRDLARATTTAEADFAAAATKGGKC
jgi:hypothetical protein